LDGQAALGQRGDGRALPEGISDLQRQRAGRNLDTDHFVYRDHLFRGSDVLATGVSSFGHFQGIHYQNFDQIEQYSKGVAAGDLPIHRALIPTPHQELIREMCLPAKGRSHLRPRLPGQFGVDILKEFATPLRNQAAGGYLTIEGDEVRLTRRGLLQADTLLPEYFEESTAPSVTRNPRLSLELTRTGPPTSAQSLVLNPNSANCESARRTSIAGRVVSGRRAAPFGGEHVPPRRCPIPYHRMLVHEQHMTVAMESYHGTSVDVKVLDRRIDGDRYSRKIVLLKSGTDSVVQFGIVRFDLNYVTSRVREEILAGEKPLGRVLIDHNVLRHIDLGAVLCIKADPAWPVTCKCPWARPRTAGWQRFFAIATGGRPLGNPRSAHRLNWSIHPWKPRQSRASSRLAASSSWIRTWRESCISRTSSATWSRRRPSSFAAAATPSSSRTGWFQRRLAARGRLVLVQNARLLQRSHPGRYLRAAAGLQIAHLQFHFRRDKTLLCHRQ